MSQNPGQHRLGREVLSLFDHAPKRDRLHVRGRFRTCPVALIDEEVPRRGRVLEIGCGHGLISAYLALSSGDRQVTGIDIDPRKIAVASHALSHLDHSSAHLEFHHVAPGELPDGPWEVIVIVDVLYLLDRSAEFALLDACVERLSEHGVLVVKETDIVPRWKHRVANAQEIVATKILRITAGSSLSFTPIADIAAHLRSRGLEVTSRRVDKGYLHPHALLVAQHRELIYHLALAADWANAQGSSNDYRVSSIGRHLDEVGFIHCSFTHQLQRVADTHYRGRSDVVLLTIDASKVNSPIREENAEGGTDLFPHIYGPLNVDAVVSARPLAPGTDGTLAVVE